MAAQTDPAGKTYDKAQYGGDYAPGDTNKDGKFSEEEIKKREEDLKNNPLQMDTHTPPPKA